jgi:hypothetical protein
MKTDAFLSLLLFFLSVLKDSLWVAAAARPGSKGLCEDQSPMSQVVPNVAPHDTMLNFVVFSCKRETIEPLL